MTEEQLNYNREIHEIILSIPSFKGVLDSTIPLMSENDEQSKKDVNDIIGFLYEKASEIYRQRQSMIKIPEKSLIKSKYDRIFKGILNVEEGGRYTREQSDLVGELEWIQRKDLKYERIFPEPLTGDKMEDKFAGAVKKITEALDKTMLKRAYEIYKQKQP